jgi:hypothetical protein
MKSVVWHFSNNNVVESAFLAFNFKNMESMGTVDVCGDGVPRHVVCLGLPCKDKNSIRIVCFSQLMRLLDPLYCIE